MRRKLVKRIDLCFIYIFPCNTFEKNIARRVEFVTDVRFFTGIYAIIFNDLISFEFIRVRSDAVTSQVTIYCYISSPLLIAKV